MRFWFGVGILATLAWFVDAGILYIGGRILLPEMGLRAPSYIIWLAISFLMVVWYCISKLIEKVLE